jgi:hypothetical protein
VSCHRWVRVADVLGENSRAACNMVVVLFLACFRCVSFHSHCLLSLINVSDRLHQRASCISISLGVRISLFPNRFLTVDT